MAICQCDNWMAAQFDTYLAQYQHGLCFSFMRGVSFTDQPKNFPESRKLSMGSVIDVSKTTLSSHHMYSKGHWIRHPIYGRANRRGKSIRYEQEHH